MFVILISSLFWPSTTIETMPDCNHSDCIGCLSKRSIVDGTVFKL